MKFLAVTGTRISQAARLEVGDRGHVRAGLSTYNESVGDASSLRVAAAILLDEPPSIDHGEITDKGYINQLAVCKRRPALIERLYATASSLEVMKFI